MKRLNIKNIEIFGEETNDSSFRKRNKNLENPKPPTPTKESALSSEKIHVIKKIHRKKIDIKMFPANEFLDWEDLKYNEESNKNVLNDKHNNNKLNNNINNELVKEGKDHEKDKNKCFMNKTMTKIGIPKKLNLFFLKTTGSFKRIRSSSPQRKDENEKEENIINKYKGLRENDLENLTELKSLIGYLSKDKGRKIEQLEIIFRLIEVLSTFSTVHDEITKKNVKNIVDILKDSIFIENEDIIKKISALKSITFSEQNTYQQITKKLIFFIDDLNLLHADINDGQQREIDQWQLKMQSLEATNNKLIEELKEADRVLREKYEKKISDLEKRNMALDREVSQMTIEYSKTKEEFMIKVEKAQNDEALLRKFFNTELEKIKHHNSILSTDLNVKESDLVKLKQSFNEFLENYKNLVGHLKDASYKIKSHEKNVSNLMNENQNLKIRAAVAWEEMTPRPHFHKFKDIFDLADDFFESKSSQKLCEEVLEMTKKMKDKKQKKLLQVRGSLKSPLQKSPTIQLKKLNFKVMSKNGISEGMNTCQNIENVESELENEAEKREKSMVKRISKKISKLVSKDEISYSQFSQDPESNND